MMNSKISSAMPAPLRRKKSAKGSTTACFSHALASCRPCAGTVPATLGSGASSTVTMPTVRQAAMLA
jgi:hypothetical protein